jgi:hypothetical protein
MPRQKFLFAKNNVKTLYGRARNALSEQPRMFKTEIHLSWKFVLGTRSPVLCGTDLTVSAGWLSGLQWDPQIVALPASCFIGEICAYWSFRIVFLCKSDLWRICPMELLLEAQVVANPVKNWWKPRVCPFYIVSCIWTHLSGCEVTVKHLVELCSCSLFHLSKELYCNCTLHCICIIHSCAATVYYALRGGKNCSQWTCSCIVSVHHVYFAYGTHTELKIEKSSFSCWSLRFMSTLKGLRCF